MSNEISDSDRQLIVDHIHEIFGAFIKQDRQKLRNTHSTDWVGFMGPSTSIERGLEAYMANAEKSLQHFRGLSYELLDIEIQLHGDLAIVFYIARYKYAAPDSSSNSIPLRSVDIYQRRDGKWIQTGSHITVIPEGGVWGEGGNRDQCDSAENRSGPSYKT